MEKSPLNLKGSALTYENFSIWAKIGIPKNESLLFEYSLFVKTPKSLYLPKKYDLHVHKHLYLPKACKKCVPGIFPDEQNLRRPPKWSMKPKQKMLTFFPTKPTWCAYHFKVDMIPLKDYNCSYRCFVNCQFVDSLLKKGYGALWPPTSLWILIFPRQLIFGVKFLGSSQMTTGEFVLQKFGISIDSKNQDLPSLRNFPREKHVMGVMGDVFSNKLPLFSSKTPTPKPEPKFHGRLRPKHPKD